MRNPVRLFALFVCVGSVCLSSLAFGWEHWGGDSLIFCTPFNEVIALDPGSGAQKWRYDPKISTSQRPANQCNCRGVGCFRDVAAGDRSVAMAPSHQAACLVDHRRKSEDNVYGRS